MNTRIPPPVVVVIIAAMMWWLEKLLAVGAFTSDIQPLLAIVFMGSGIGMMLVAAFSFYKSKTTINPLDPSKASHLITTGLFGFSRNPIYLADLLVLIAWAIWLGNIFNIALLVVFIVYINRFQIAPEERALGILFGDAYREYCSRVRRWI
jgi:protein-S-isoprenylcysteine O-methyltransferase Ste14